MSRDTSRMPGAVATMLCMPRSPLSGSFTSVDAEPIAPGHEVGLPHSLPFGSRNDEWIFRLASTL